ncbi:MAG TPA: Uma2 family endonuclease [Gemmatimonadaceae bacterium]
MPAIAKHRWTAADVRELIEETRRWPRYELLDGELLVTPSPNSPHQFAVDSMLVILYHYCERERVGQAVSSPADIELAPETIMQPDVFVIPASAFPADEPLAWPHVKSLLLAVEVLSPSTIGQDRVRKRDFYLANGVAEYWIVDLDARVIERWTPERETPDLRRDEITWQPAGAGAPLVIDVREFFAGNKGLAR